MFVNEKVVQKGAKKVKQCQHQYEDKNEIRENAQLLKEWRPWREEPKMRQAAVLTRVSFGAFCDIH